MSKYFVIRFDLFLAAMPGQWYSCLNMLTHAIIGNMQHAYQFSILISLCPESQASLENSICCFWLSTGARQTGRLLQSYLGQGRGDSELLKSLVLSCPRVPFLWLTTHGRCYSFMSSLGAKLGSCSWIRDAGGKLWFPNPQRLYFLCLCASE